MKSTTVQQVRTTSVRKWGNGHGVLLPKAFVDTLDLAHAEVKTVLRGSSIVLTKTKKSPQKPLTLKDLVRGVSRRDKHELIDFGAPRGREIW
jgi:antitoxin MazE